MKYSSKMLILFLLSALILSGCAAKKPIIAITSVCQLNKDTQEPQLIYISLTYINAVLESGGVPVVLPTNTNISAIERYVDEFDGLIIIGGGDIPPEFYGQQKHETVKEMADLRFQFEKTLIPAWLKSGKPILGVCLGHQFSNVCFGGTLIQDIPSQVGTSVIHRKKDEIATHSVEIDPKSMLFALLGEAKVQVNSIHHQAVDKVGNGFTVTARSDDGLIEATERTDGNWGLFLQWHPERLETKHRQAIFGAFIDACR
ncbi:MAG: gamma-glutamyl-gamma-aminobutyrate hydrolase family protein [Phycisphaerae bacterium]|nr:gamma-glutamyl-gamma-aminobutyrate hydrolase family protein [Phycisphaerae bacterium]